jgi:YidC/Oxa1 family membrane protein insertase
MKIKNLFDNSDWQGLKKFEELPLSQKQIVFYAEDENSMIFYESIINELICKYDTTVCYVTSSKNDPILKTSENKIKVFYVGQGVARTKFFLNLKANILITTMPDLETFHIKRSKTYPVHYVYIFHSMVSTHLIYRKGAFDNFDTIFCVGNHQIEEIKNTEIRYDLKSKNLIHHGYGHLDKMLEKISTVEEEKFMKDNSIQILVAPSWGSNGLLENIGEELVNILLSSGFMVIVRPHPVTQKKSKKMIEKLESKFSKKSNFKLEKDVRNFDTFFSSDIMISDWSGVALEFAFAFEKPILYVDMPKKVNNLDYKDIKNIPLEVRIREEIGYLVSPLELKLIPEKIKLLIQNTSKFKKKISHIREESVFNIGNSGKIGAQKIIEIINEESKIS